MDIGGVSADLHPATGLLTVFVYDGNEGGAGFAERGFGVAANWLRATAEAILSCECQAGCPSCVQSPKCGTGNEPLAKDGALVLLETLLAGAPDPAGLGTAPVTPARVPAPGAPVPAPGTQAAGTPVPAPGTQAAGTPVPAPRTQAAGTPVLAPGTPVEPAPASNDHEDLVVPTTTISP